MKRCIILTALPGSGKSTYVEELKAEQFKATGRLLDVFVYSTDQFIENRARFHDTTYDAIFTDTIKEATAAMDTMLRHAVHNHIPLIICDQTNMTAKKRASLMQKVGKDYTFESYCVVPPQDQGEAAELQRRLKSRPGKSIPQFVIDNMLNSFERPSLDEGFSMVTSVNVFGEYAAVEFGAHA